MAVAISDAVLDAVMDPERPAIFFLGAGNSMDSQLPGAGDLVKRIRAGLPDSHQSAIQQWEQDNPDKPWGPTLEDLAEICLKIDGDKRRFIDLIPWAEWQNAEPHEGHIVLAELWAETLVGEPFTTNLDTLIEKGFERALVRRLPGCFRVEHFRETLRPRVYKVHGCLTEPYDTIWAVSEVTRKDWDQAWKNFATGKEMLEASAFIFVGFRIALPYLSDTYDKAGKPKAFMVNPAPFGKFQSDTYNQPFLNAFNITEADYVEATSKSFFEALRVQVQKRILQRQLSETVPRLVAKLDLPEPHLQPPGKALLDELQQCSPAGLQSLLKRCLLGDTYVGIGQAATSHLMRGLFLLRLAYPIEIQTDLAEPTCHLMRGTERTPLFFAFGDRVRKKSVVAKWRAKTNRDWPDDMKPLLVKPPLVLVFGEGAMAQPDGLPNIMTGKPVPGPYGPEPKFAYVSYDDLVDRIEAGNLAGTAKGIHELVEQVLGGTLT